MKNLNFLFCKMAEQIAQQFSEVYKTARNPFGKQHIIIYGGRPELRESFSDLVQRSLPRGVDAFVFNQDKKIDMRERDEDPRAFYIDLKDKHKINAFNLLQDIKKVYKERKKAGRRTLVRIIPEEGSDYTRNYNSLEKFLWKKGVVCYLDLYEEGIEEDYCIDLNRVEIVYSNRSLQ